MSRHYINAWADLGAILGMAAMVAFIAMVAP
jgi:hypothetical protein